MKKNGVAALVSWGLCFLTGLFMLVLSQGCATYSKPFPHGITVSNYDVPAIHDITVLYGEMVIKFAGVASPKRLPYPNQGGLSNAVMPVPSEMTVIWFTEKGGAPHRVTIPLKGRLSPIYQLANWEIRFYGERIELWREDATGPINPHTYIQPREEKKVFP